MDAASVWDSRLPEQFDRYSILEHLATGGQAEVYLARQAGLQGFEKLVVIKRIRPDLSTESGTIEAFLDEARLVAGLDHPHIVQVHEIGFVAGSYFFVMEHVDGADLRQLLAAAAAANVELTLANALAIAIDVCAALHYAHDKCGFDGEPLGIIHRDMSPSNVLVSHDGTVKVCDFGIAKATTCTTETVRGVVKGKFSYMSPEQCTGGELDRRSDVFALGILLYELTTRTHLFRGGCDYDVMHSIVDAPIPPPSTRVDGYPPELEAIVMRALAHDPEDRYPTAQALQGALEAFACEHKLALSSTNLAALMGRLFEKRRDSASRLIGATAGGATAHTPGRVPTLARIGVRTCEAETVVLPSRVLAREVPAKRPRAACAHRATGWLAGAAIAAVASLGALAIEHHLVESEQRTARIALALEAERLGAAIDGAARLAHARVDAIAGTSAMRAAVAADAPALHGILVDEVGFAPRAGETVEVFRVQRDAPATTMLRLPRSAAGLAPPAGPLHLVAHGTDLAVIATAAIGAPRQPARGLLSLSSPIDLESARRRLSRLSTRAALVIDESELRLVDGSAPSWTRTAVPLESGAASLQLVAAPFAASAPCWSSALRYASLGATALLLLGFLIARRRTS